MLMWLFAALVVAVGFIGRHVDGSADELIGGDAPVLLVVTWLVVALLLAVAVTRRIQRFARVEAGSGLVVAYDALPWLLTVAWGIVVGALLTDHWILAVIAGALCIQQLTLLVPRTRRDRLPGWAEGAPTFDLVVANVLVHNKTPEVAARQLATCGADVVIVNESTAGFLEQFDALGGMEAYPYRISDPSDESEYAVTVASRSPLGPGSGIRDVGRLRLVMAELEPGGASLWVLATHLSATLDRYW